MNADPSRDAVPGTQETAAEGRSDGELLRLYVEQGSDAAFAALGRRYSGLIYAACCRELGDRTLAEDAAQGVLLLLSQKARALRKSPSLAGWLYSASRYVAKNLQKQERRRRMHEAAALLAAKPSAAPANPLWESIEAPFYDALHRLKPTDREVILLRFVQEQSLGEIGASLGISENTARMRVSRALEKIRGHLGRVGIAVTTAALAALLEEHTAPAAGAAVRRTVPDFTGQAVGKSGAREGIAAAVRQSARQMRLKAMLPAVAGGIVLLVVGSVYRQTLPHQLDAGERRRFFQSLGGTWTGTLEYADDRTGQRSTFPTTVTCRVPNGDTLECTATFAGTPQIDVTTFAADPRTDTVRATNGGAQSSHNLTAVGTLVRSRGGDAQFEGMDSARYAETRIRFQVNGTHWVWQEEYRRPGSTVYRFRNRYTLDRTTGTPAP